ncbi:MAG: glycosyltransferase [Candidatus Accumulibacter sp.]|uniref:Glycosyltransferase n=1 Tax=Candidatus Accumulibacter proximus TaxID=2954385 RepID=A0A935UEZ0_9PROT|nr:glycosyltransferase [Candidatus Accumulibacter proximus]
MKRILMIGYHFPPLAGSSGIQRTLRFVQHLPSFGWQPLVITANVRAYERISDDLMADVPTDTIVHRAFALDTARHLSLGGRYVGWMARPDRWVSWRFDAVRVGLRMIKRYRPDAIWSTYPIATAHLIGADLNRRTGVPWLADFRDPMAQEGYPEDPLLWQSFKRIEMEAVRNARLSLFTTPGAARVYRQRYPEVAERIVVLENGYDEESFSFVQLEHHAPINPGAITLLHSGIVYPAERDPTELIVALRVLKESGQLVVGTLKIRFRAPVHVQPLRALAQTHGVEDFIECCPPIAYRDAIAEMLRADGLLVMQAANCNEQIPAKIYEYLRARRPIVALTDPAGDTATTLAAAGVKDIVPLDSATAIADQLMRFVDASRRSAIALPYVDSVKKASRLARTAELVSLLNSVVP